MSGTLQDLGERRIIGEILPKYVQAVGDDCATIPLSDRDLVLTMDPVPEPAARLLGNDPDLYWTGWLLVTINASDLAANGANPVAFLAAIDAPATMDVLDFERLLQGISEACERSGLRYIGGNLRESARLTAVGTAIGTCKTGMSVHRTGAHAGDIIVSVGQGGVFWRDALLIEHTGNLPVKESSPIFRPASQIKTMCDLAGSGLIRAAIDNSDGLLPTLKQLAQANGLSCQLGLDRLSVPNTESLVGVDPARLWLGWGDWNVIAAVRPGDLARTIEIGASHKTAVIPIGEFLSGDTDIILKRGVTSAPAPRLESERFALDSWFSSGIRGYVELLLNVSLP